MRFGFAARPPRGRRARHRVGRRLILAALPGAEAANNNAAPRARNQWLTSQVARTSKSSFLEVQA
jgi:hypothetical protein